MPTPTGKISQAQFIQNLKVRNPALAQFPDRAIMERVLAADPTVKDKVYTPDDAAADEQARLMGEANKGTAFTRSVLDALPGIGGIVGGIASTPETLGAGTLPGIALGTGAGRGLRDIAAQMLGLEDTTPVEKAGNITMDSLLAATVPGTIDAIAHPIQSSRVAADMASKIPSAFTPRWMKRWGINLAGPLEDWAKGGASEMDPHIRPSWQTTPGFPEESSSPFPRPTTTGFEGPPPTGPTDWTVNQPPRAPRPQGPSSTSMSSDYPLPKEPIPNSFTQEPKPTSSGPTRTQWGSTVPLSDEPTPFSARKPPSASGPVESGTTVKPDMSGKLNVTGDMKPIIQVDSNTGTMRGSVDGGKTWKYTVDNGKTWTEE